MPNCVICAEPLRADQKVCDVCGTSVAETTPPPLPPQNSAPTPPPALPPASADAGGAAAIATGPRVCPLCSKTYASDYADEFCHCGGELVAGVGDDASSGISSPAEATQQPPVTPGPTQPTRPPAGTVCLVLYSEREPVHYCPIDKDVTIIGRSDAVRGDFPDFDLGELLDSAISRKISRKHAMLLRSRDKQAYVLRPLAGNTGTQIEKDLATELQDYPLSSGTRIILGGTVRLKFETL